MVGTLRFAHPTILNDDGETRLHSPAARIAPESCETSRAFEEGGRRECRVSSCTRSLACNEQKHTSLVTTGEAETDDIPCAMVLTLICVLSPVSVTS